MILGLMSLVSWQLAQQRFDPLALALSLLKSATSAGLAYASATLGLTCY
jgi:hypothetical protein